MEASGDTLEMQTVLSSSSCPNIYCTVKYCLSGDTLEIKQVLSSSSCPNKYCTILYGTLYNNVNEFCTLHVHIF